MNSSSHPEDIKFARFEIFGIPALIADTRRVWLPRNIPGLDRLYAYDLRHGDDDSIPLTVEHCVVVNHFATIFTVIPLLDNLETPRDITQDDWTYRSDLADCTPLEFLHENM